MANGFCNSFLLGRRNGPASLRKRSFAQRGRNARVTGAQATTGLTKGRREGRIPPSRDACLPLFGTRKTRYFAFLFPVIDVAFGMAYFPRRDEYPKAGLARQPEPAGLWDYLSQPFR